MFSGINPGSLLLILLIVVLVFGTKKLTGLGSDVGGAIKGFRKAMSDDDKTDKTDSDPAQLSNEESGSAESVKQSSDTSSNS